LLEQLQLEPLGRVPEAERLSGEELWKSHVKAWTAELASDSPPSKPAEQYTVAMLLSLELTVVDTTLPLLTRALAWIVLVMVWGSMRCDDMQSALPHCTTLSNYGLRAVLAKTKTSGPDKVQLDDGWPESVEEQGLLLLVWRHHITKQYIKDVL